jgi:formylglycine-generating enzyme required for sulfatase activity
VPKGEPYVTVLETAPQILVRELNLARAKSQELFNVLKPDALYERPIAERHRVLFYIGHLEGFDSIFVCREGLGLTSPDPEFDKLFQAGIDPDSSHLPNDKPGDWPPLDAIRAYADRCRAHVDANLARAPESMIHLSIEHRLMHMETLAYMFHNFGYDKKRVSDARAQQTSSLSQPAASWCDVPEGEATLGRRRDDNFAWDNEYEQVSRFVPSFGIQSHKVTNGDYLRFVRDGASAPHFWTRRGDEFFYRGMFEKIPLPLDWPVYVTLNEAQAYARWAGKDLPTEEQFHRAAYGSPDGAVREYPWGMHLPSPQYGNFDFRRWDPEPVTATPNGRSAWGVHQLVGNGWEWTKTAFGPFPGFRPHRAYPGYSANFFDGAHFVMKGGSPRTAAPLLRSSFRNWFRPDYPYVYATFRCVEN